MVLAGNKCLETALLLNDPAVTTATISGLMTAAIGAGLKLEMTMTNGLQAWLVEVDTGRLVAGPICVERTNAGAYYADKPLKLAVEGPVRCRLCISQGELTVLEDPSLLLVHHEDEVWVGRNQAGDTTIRDEEPYLWSMHFGAHSQWMSSKPMIHTPTKTVTFGVPISEGKGYPPRARA